jgi:hypothetical protein
VLELELPKVPNRTSAVFWRSASMAVGVVEDRSVDLFLDVSAARLNNDLCPSGLVLDPERSRRDWGGGGKAGVVWVDIETVCIEAPS